MALLPPPEMDRGLLVKLSLSVMGDVDGSGGLWLLSATRRRKLGIRNRPVDRDEVLSMDATSSAFSLVGSSSAPSSSLISWRVLGPAAMGTESLLVNNGGARVGMVGRGGREGARSETGLGVSDAFVGSLDGPSPLALVGVGSSLFALVGFGSSLFALLGERSSSSSLSISTSSASRYHFRRRVQRVQPS